VTRGPACPYCLGTSSRVRYTRPGEAGDVRRWRTCQSCGERFTTEERSSLLPRWLATPKKEEERT
jgi:transcriptional regulator NrdR family protein